MHSPPSQARSNKLVLKTKLMVRRHFCGHAHERSRMWIDHLFCNEQSSHTRGDTLCFVTHPSAAPMVTVSCAGSECLLCRRLHGRSLVSQNSLSRMAK